MTLLYLLYRLRVFYPLLSVYDLLIAGLEELLNQNRIVVNNEKVILDKIEDGRMFLRVWNAAIDDYEIVSQPINTA